MSKLDLRPSPIAGAWYPAQPERLVQQITEYIDAAPQPEVDGEIIGLMVPHAGHAYSGPVAAYAFKAVQGLRFDAVIVVAPMHYPHQQPLLSSAHEAYSTPLGPVMIDQPALQSLDQALRLSLGVGLKAVRNDPEHALEIELPFLQVALGAPFRLIPVMVHSQSMAVAQALGQALAYVVQNTLAGQRVLLVASTDLSHFYSEQQAHVLDQTLLAQVSAFDPGGVMRVEDEGTGFACGGGALAAVMWAAQGLGATRAQVLHYATSAAVTHDTKRVVGYAAALFI